MSMIPYYLEDFSNGRARRNSVHQFPNPGELRLFAEFLENMKHRKYDPAQCRDPIIRNHRLCNALRKWDRGSRDIVAMGERCSNWKFFLFWSILQRRFLRNGLLEQFVDPDDVTSIAIRRVLVCHRRSMPMRGTWPATLDKGISEMSDLWRVISSFGDDVKDLDFDRIFDAFHRVTAPSHQWSQGASCSHAVFWIYQVCLDLAQLEVPRVIGASERLSLAKKLSSFRYIGEGCVGALMTIFRYDGGGLSSCELYQMQKEGRSGALSFLLGVLTESMGGQTRWLFGKKFNLHEMQFVLCEYRKYLLHAAGLRPLPRYVPFLEREKR